LKLSRSAISFFISICSCNVTNDSNVVFDADTENKEDDNIDNSGEYNDEDEDDDNNLKGSDKSTRYGFHNTSRSVIQFLISKWPKALYIQNNFQAIPVDTVLDNVIPTRTKKKIVSVFGLYNDPPTARILLLAQHLHQLHPFTRPKYIQALHYFNWMARKDALYASLVGERKYCMINFMDGMSFQCTLKYNKTYSLETQGNFNNAMNTTINRGGGGGGKNKSSNISQRTKNSILPSSNTSVNNVKKDMNELSLSRLTLVEIKMVTKYNILARLREHGLDVVVRYIINMI